jgi:hypothetical protein
MTVPINGLVSTLPERARCRCLLADGRSATITATRRARAGRADVKCSAPGAPALAERMQQVVRLARHTEARIDSRDQVVLSIDIDPGTRDWELAAVLADRMVRGLARLDDTLCANGWSDAWHLGRIDGHAIAAVPADSLLGGPDGLPHLGALNGQPDVANVVSSARAWFPLHSGGINDSLCWVEVSVYPLAAQQDQDDDAIAVPGLDLTRQLAVRQALLGSRDFDRCPPQRWRTTVRFGQPRFQGASYELALVMADRLARGRDYVARGRIIATGTSSAWHAGQVDTVEGMAPKCALIAAEAAPGDRVLLPHAWAAALPAGFAEQVRAGGASLACVAQIGMF